MAQESLFRIEGRILSGRTKLPVSNGSVNVGTRGADIDSSGYFSFPVSAVGVQKISFFSLDFEKKDTAITITDSLYKLTWLIYSGCRKFNRQKALTNIAEKKPLILLQGGIAPVTNSSYPAFSRKYGIRFYEFGDSIEEYQDCIYEYNKTVFEYLDKKFGKKWRKKVATDIIGLD